MAVAQLSDVTARLERPLTDEENAVVPQLLDDAEALIVSRIPDIVSRANDDATLKTNLIRVEAYAVIRVLRNPEGYTYENEGAYGYSLNKDFLTGQLLITDEEWSLLGYTSAAYSILPKIGGQSVRPWWNTPPWNFQYGNWS